MLKIIVNDLKKGIANSIIVKKKKKKYDRYPIIVLMAGIFAYFSFVYLQISLNVMLICSPDNSR